MSCGVAIVCSSTTAMPETCEDAAIYFDPLDVVDFSKKIELFIKDEDLKLSLRLKSKNRVKELPDYKDVTVKTYEIIKNLFNNK